MGYQIYFGDFLRRLRKQRRMSLRALSQKTCPRVSEKYISLLERRYRERPSRAVIDSLLKALDSTEKESCIIEHLINYRTIDSEVLDFFLKDENVKVHDLGTLIFIAAADDRNPNPKSASYFREALNALDEMAKKSHEDWVRQIADKMRRSDSS